MQEKGINIFWQALLPCLVSSYSDKTSHPFLRSGMISYSQFFVCCSWSQKQCTQRWKLIYFLENRGDKVRRSSESALDPQNMQLDHSRKRDTT